jgi:hypothetical protein
MGAGIVTRDLERDISPVQQNIPFEFAKVVHVFPRPRQDGLAFTTLAVTTLAVTCLDLLAVSQARCDSCAVHTPEVAAR